MAMFESLQEGLSAAMKSLRGKARLSESNMRDGLKMVEQSLLEADVSYEVVQDFMAAVSEQALGEKVLSSLDPSEQVVGIVHQELINLIGPDAPPFALREGMNTLMLCGLQGSGKTTTCGKLARLILKHGGKPLLVAADLQRPAAIDQLHVIGEQLGVPVYSQRGVQDPVKVCRDAIKAAKEQECNIVILDTAGRLAIDEELMKQLQTIESRVQPDQVLFVVDGMTGQDAVNSARAFNEALELDGVIMTKLDGDTRGGALLSVKHVTGVPIKFIGTGEHMESLELFRPDGMAGRILGMGDIVQMVSEAQDLYDEKEREQFEEKMAKGEFTLDDFKGQLEKFANPGLMTKMMSLLPGFGDMKKMMAMSGDEDPEGGMKRMVGIINSMTPSERKAPKLVDPSRRRRIADGAGVQANEVGQLIKQFDQMAPMMQGMAGKGMGERMQAIEELKNSGAFDPGARGTKTKKGTGKRLSPADKKKQNAARKKERRNKRKDK